MRWPLSMACAVLKGMGAETIDGDFCRGRLKNSHLLECDLNCQSQSSNFSFVDLRRGVEHDEEGKQEGDEVGVRNQPAFVIGVSWDVACGGSYALGSPPTAAGPWASVRNPSSFASRHAGVHPLENGNHTLERHFADDLLFADADS